MHAEVETTIARLHERERASGYDPFGFRPDILERLLPPTHFLYRRWFRTLVSGIEHVPDGRVLLIANHSGQLPLDGAMIGAAMLFEPDPPRVIRSMVERWIPSLPFVSTFFSRAGQVVGTPANARALLERGNPVLVFPEGSAGISKTFGERYQLQQFGLGFMRLALETRTPIVPVGVVGAEEQFPSVYNARGLAKAMGIPALPVILNLPVPLPVRYRIYFGEPLTFGGDHDDEDRVIASKVSEVQDAIRALIARGLAERPHPFA